MWRSRFRVISGRQGEVRMRSARMSMGVDRQREVRPHPCQTQTKRSGELANQERKMRRSLRKTFPKKVIDGLLKLPYTDKCRWQAFPLAKAIRRLSFFC